MVSISCCWPPIHAGQRLVSTKVNLTAQNWISAFLAWLVTGACWMPSCTSWLVLVVLPVIMAISFSVLACRAARNTSPSSCCSRNSTYLLHGPSLAYCFCRKMSRVSEGNLARYLGTTGWSKAAVSGW